MRRVDAGELARLQKLGDAQDREARAAQRQTLEQACSECIGHWRRCVMVDPDIRARQCYEFNRCVERKYADPSGCATP